jgi:Ser/Thr protein kinase RdoA (MazF antagonist)
VVNRSLKAKLSDITNQYGLRLHNVVAYDSLYKQNAAFRASTDKGTFLIKPFHKRVHGTKSGTKGQITRVSSFFHKLKKSGYSHAPNWLTTKDGRYWVNLNGRLYYMTEWLEGRSIQMDNDRDFSLLGRALANLHTSCQDTLPAMSPYTQKQITLLQAQDRLFQLRLKDIQSLTAPGKWFRSHGGKCCELTREAWEIIHTREVKRSIKEETNHPTLVHGDVTVPNVIINSNGLFLIDWDCLRMDSTYNEIAKTVLNTTGYNLAYIHAFLHGYQEIKPLKPAERHLITALYRLPREAWYAAGSLVLGNTPPIFRILQHTWENRIKAIHWMDDWTRQSPTVEVST